MLPISYFLPPRFSLEEVSEMVNGHTLKLRCLEGLWRQQSTSNDAGENVTEGAKSGDHTRSSNSGSCSGTGTSGAAAIDADVSARAEEEGSLLASTAPALRAGFSGLLERLGSNSLSASQKEVRRETI